MNWLKRIIIDTVNEQLNKILPKVVLEQINLVLPGEYLSSIPMNDNDRLYVLVLSKDVDMDAVRKEFEPYSGKINLIVVQANQASLVELVNE